jgi:hypothetical protein
MRAFDMSRYQRVIAVDAGRITGSFHVSGHSRERASWVTAHDVTVWDEGHNGGRLYYSNDLTGSVEHGVATLSKHMVSSDRLAEVEEVWDDMLAVLVAVVAEFWSTDPRASVDSREAIA